MDAVLAKLLTLPNVTLCAIAQTWLLTRVFPHQLPEHARHLSDLNTFLWALWRVLGINYLFFVIYLGLIWPYFIAPFRSFPTPKEARARIAYFLSIARPSPGQIFLEWASKTPGDEGVALLRSPFLRTRLLAFGPKPLQELLVTNAYDFEKPSQIRGFLRHVLGNGLIITEGDVHKFQRKHVMPAFSFRHIKDLYPMMWTKALELTKAVNAEIREGTNPSDGDDGHTGSVEMNGWASKVTLDIIGIAGLGREFHYMKNSDDQLVRDYEELLTPDPEKVIFFLAWAFGPQKLISRLPWRLNRVFKAATTSLTNICRQFVREKREGIKSGTDEHFDILSLLIKSDDFSDNDIADQLLTFLAAGHETTSSALTWAAFLLSTHRDYQTRLRDEIRAALPPNALAGSESFDIATTLESLPLLNAICSETLRLYPTVPLTVRRAVRPTTLLSRRIPAGTDIMICPWATNRLPAIWGADADDFKPERWIEPDGKPNNHGGAESNYNFLTFLHGPRQCIGQGFARAELRCLLAAFVATFEWELDMKVEDVKPGGVITIKPQNGLKLKLKEVTK